MNVLLIFLICAVALVQATVPVPEIHDPLNIFCGSVSCYDVLGVERASDIKTIKKAYRKLSLTEHPDKSAAQNATEVFRVISKAYTVLTGNESRPLFDYYLDHPRDYFKVSGQHWIRNIPHSDVRVVITMALLLISWFFHTIQSQKYEKAVKYLRTYAASGQNLKNGGTKQTMELHKRAAELYDLHIAQLKAGGDKQAGKTKMLKDPLFLTFVDKVVNEVKIEGGYRKPEWRDLVIVQTALLPHTLFLYAKTYHRRYISKEPLGIEDQVEMARDKLGLATWEELQTAEQDRLLAKKIWLPEVYNAWFEERTAEENKRMGKAAAKQGKAAPRRGGRKQDDADELSE